MTNDEWHHNAGRLMGAESENQIDFLRRMAREKVEGTSQPADTTPEWQAAETIESFADALAFYADREHHHDTEPHGSSKVTADGGKRARQALERLKS